MRAYNRQGQIAGGVPTDDGNDATTLICQMLTQPDVELVHLRNIGYGCYNFAVRCG